LTGLARDLADLGGVEVTPRRLLDSIALYNENRAWIERIQRLRASSPWLVPTSELYLVLRAGNALPVEEHTHWLRSYHDAVKASSRHPVDMARVAIRGCFCEQPPLDLVKTLERAGCVIVDDDWLLSQRWYGGPVDIAAGEDPFDALVRAFLTRSPACPSMYIGEGTKGEALVKSVRDCRAEGVVFAAPSFCDPALLDQPMTMAAVKSANIPCTSLLYAENTGQFQTIREQAGTFADAIRLS
jgi:benzoyl-CoA reductase subunit C